MSKHPNQGTAYNRGLSRYLGQQKNKKPGGQEPVISKPKREKEDGQVDHFRKRVQPIFSECSFLKSSPLPIACVAVPDSHYYIILTFSLRA